MKDGKIKFISNTALLMHIFIEQLYLTFRRSASHYSWSADKLAAYLALALLSLDPQTRTLHSILTHTHCVTRTNNIHVSEFDLFFGDRARSSFSNSFCFFWNSGLQCVCTAIGQCITESASVLVVLAVFPQGSLCERSQSTERL